MAINQDRLHRIQGLGLTEYEARTYLALLDFEIATASKIANLSRVPRTKIYQALEGLEQKQLIKVVPERPKKYVVVPIEQYLDRLETDHLQRAKDLGAERPELVAEFSPKGRMDLQDTGSFLTIAGRGNVTTKLQDMVEATKREFFYFCTPNAAQRTSYHAATMEERAQAGAVFTLVCQETDANRAHLRSIGGFVDVRESPVSIQSTGFAIRDGEEALIVHFMPDTPHHFHGEDVAIWCNDPGVVKGLRALLGHAVEAGIPVELLRQAGIVRSTTPTTQPLARAGATPARVNPPMHQGSPPVAVAHPGASAEGDAPPTSAA